MSPRVLTVNKVRRGSAGARSWFGHFPAASPPHQHFPVLACSAQPRWDSSPGSFPTRRRTLRWQRPQASVTRSRVCWCRRRLDPLRAECGPASEITGVDAPCYWGSEVPKGGSKVSLSPRPPLSLLVTRAELGKRAEAPILGTREEQLVRFCSAVTLRQRVNALHWQGRPPLFPLLPLGPRRKSAANGVVPNCPVLRGCILMCRSTGFDCSGPRCKAAVVVLACSMNCWFSSLTSLVF